jgi:hypothetical protein
LVLIEVHCEAGQLAEDLARGAPWGNLLQQELYRVPDGPGFGWLLEKNEIGPLFCGIGLTGGFSLQQVVAASRCGSTRKATLSGEPVE